MIKKPGCKARVVQFFKYERLGPFYFLGLLGHLDAYFALPSPNIFMVVHKNRCVHMSEDDLLTERICIQFLHM